MRNNYDRRKGLHVLKFLVLGVVFVGVVGFVTMQLWNWLIPELFHGPVISFWQALGLLLLGKLLFGWHNHQRSWNDKWARGREWKERIREKMAGMTPEEQEKMREHLRNRCRPGFGAWGRDRDKDWNKDWETPGKEENESH